jgi:phosphate-selective porin
VIGLLIGSVSVQATETTPGSSAEQEHKLFEYTAKGLDITSADGNFHAHINWRAQLRFTQSNYDDGSIDQSPDVREGTFTVNRARFKLGGHAYRPWLTYYLEYDFPGTRLLDLRFTARAADGLRVRLGQWKFPYNRERVDSSGKQQFAERSIATPYFTIDRQQGIAVFGRLFSGTAADSWYNLAVHSATGRGGTGSVDRPGVLARWQWNFMGRDLGFSQCDLKRHDRPTGSFALAATSWRGPFTAFSSAGGGQLPGFGAGDEDRYDVRQAVAETALQYRGFSWQQELHWKQVEDTSSGTITDLIGGYAQAGVFLNALSTEIPEALEMAIRFAEVDPNRDRADDHVWETTLGFNWFFSGHANKITLDLSRLHDRGAEPGRQWETRLRLQWDVSF